MQLKHIIVTLYLSILTTSTPVLASATDTSEQALHKYKGMPIEPKEWEPFLGIELLYLKPNWTTNPAYLISTVSTGNLQKSEQAGFEYGFTPTPVFTAGFISPRGIGFRARYWYLNDSENLSTRFDNSLKRLMTAGPLGVVLLSTAGLTSGFFDNFTFESTLSMQTADAEIIIDRQYNEWHILLSGGARYASIDQTYIVHNHGETSGITLAVSEHSNFLHSSQSSDGFGPTLNAEVNYAVGWGNLSLYGNGRNSFIFGTRSENVRARIENTMIGTTFEEADTGGNTLFTIFEGEFGVNWTKQFNPGIETQWRFGVVGQTWLNVSNSSNSGNLNDNFTVNQTGEDNSALNLGLIGFSLSGTVIF